MAAALECWSGRPSTDEDAVEQVLMKTHDRSESFPFPNTTSSSTSSAPSKPTSPQSTVQKQRWHQRFRCLSSSAIASLKSSLNIIDASSSSSSSDSTAKAAWGVVVRHLTQLYPGSQLPEKLISNVRRHFDSLPLSYAQVGFDMKDVLLHIKLIEQASADDHLAIDIQELSNLEDSQSDGQGSMVFKLTFACNSTISLSSMSGILDSSAVCCKKVQIFEKKGLTLGIAVFLVQVGHEKQFKLRIGSALKSASKKPSKNNVKLPFGLCGCQEENGMLREDEIGGGGDSMVHDRDSVSMGASDPSFVVSVDEWQTVRSGGDEIGRWMLPPNLVEFSDRMGPNSFRGVYRGKKVWIKKLRGCETGSAYEIEVRRDLLELMTSGHKNVLQMYGLTVHGDHGMCVVTRAMEGGSVHDALERNRRIQVKEVVRIATDVAEAMKFMNDRGVAYQDLNRRRILLDRQGNACVGDMGVVIASKSVAGEIMEYETAGYRWLAPEIIAGDPETVTETWMSNVYSFGMVVWEMVAGESAYSSYSPVQAAVGIAACGLRPDIPKDCPQVLRLLMTKCWNNCPSKRPQFSEILSILQRSNVKQ
ncbi:Serine/threonine-protein kinase HT1 [Acorus gramineus]|uniref:Serine/threonine-protein kinase HT1 n=1 Tax=Acorus gramineus TaxID=55184 RepID=A0AAV9B318_ACOGR|nr:Serine/threonine-protein kinase HT1 [Acorus gramineus]